MFTNKIKNYIAIELLATSKSVFSELMKLPGFAIVLKPKSIFAYYMTIDSKGSLPKCTQVAVSLDAKTLTKQSVRREQTVQKAETHKILIQLNYK